MKHVFTFLVLLMLWAAPSAVKAYSGTIRNSSGSLINTVDKDGTVRNSSGSRIGQFHSDGTVRNASGSYAGKVYDDGKGYENVEEKIDE